MSLIIIAGLPATGKSTLARKIGEALNLPILEKDEIKEALFDQLGYRNLSEKRNLDLAANAVLLRCAQAILKNGNSLIVVNNFDSNMSPAVQKIVDNCNCACVTIFLNGDADVLYRRYVARDKQGVRHLGHTFIDRYPPLEGDEIGRSMTREYFADRFEKHGMGEFRLKGSRIEIDATYPETIQTEQVINEIKKALTE